MAELTTLINSSDKAEVVKLLNKGMHKAYWVDDSSSVAVELRDRDFDETVIRKELNSKTLKFAFKDTCLYVRGDDGNIYSLYDDYEVLGLTSTKTTNYWELSLGG